MGEMMYKELLFDLGRGVLIWTEKTFSYSNCKTIVLDIIVLNIVVNKCAFGKYLILTDLVAKKFC